MNNWQDYLENVGTGTLNNHLDQVELLHVHLTRELNNLIDFVYPDLHHTDPNAVILATLNATIDSINSRIIDDAPGVSTLYRLIHVMLYPTYTLGHGQGRGLEGFMIQMLFKNHGPSPSPHLSKLHIS